MVSELGKILGCMFFFAFWEVGPAQNLEKYKKVAMCAHATNQ